MSSATGAKRVASLLPAATEIVCALGARERLVGRSHECDFPADLRDVPVLTSSKVLDSGTSAGIDRDVRAVVKDALAVYDVDGPELERAAPDVIVTQDLCDVCAISFEEVQAAVIELLGDAAHIVSLKPLRLADVWGDVRRVAAGLELVEAGEALVGELEARVAAIAERAQGAGSRPRVLTVEWLDPVMVGGTWMPELVELAGGESMVTSPGEHAPTLDLEQLSALRPDVVLFKPCGFDLERTQQESALVQSLVEVLAPGRAYLSDGNAYFNRPGPRLVESLEILAACTHPELFTDFAQRHASALIQL